MENNNKNTSKFAITGLVLGIGSALGLYELLAIFPILAIIFSSIALHRIKLSKETGRKIAIAGLILGVLYTMQFGIKTLLRSNNYFQDLHNQQATTSVDNNSKLENEEKDLKYCVGGQVKNCNVGYSCSGGQVFSCSGGISMSCTGGNWSLGTTCIHGSKIPHTYKNACQHGQTIPHTYTNKCVHGYNYAHNNQCEHGYIYSHTYIKKCVHGFENAHYYE